MSETTSQAIALHAPSGPAHARRDETTKRFWTWALIAFVVANGVYIFYIWASGGEDGTGYHWNSVTATVLSLGRLTAFLAGFLAVIEVLLLARLPFLERLVGFDRLTIWHRWNGHAVIYLALAHVVFTVWGYSNQDGTSWFQEYWNWLTLPQKASAPAATVPTGGGALNPKCLAIPNPCLKATTSPYPGIITATIGTALLVVVLVTSLIVVRRKLSYEWWYAIHFTAYAGIALAWFHMIPDGNDLHSPQQHWHALYMRIIYGGTLLLVLWYRLFKPLVNTYRFDMKVAEVIHEGPGVISLRITGRNLDKLHTKAGQFFFWRFFTKGFWYTQHPYSLSEAPKGNSFRITIKNLGDHSAKVATIPIGTRVFAEGPFGVFTADSRTEDKALLIAGGIGITPVRALLEQMDGDVVALYRVVSDSDIVFGPELEELAKSRGIKVNYVVGDHASTHGRHLLSPAHLRELVPDIGERDVYICGPVAMIDYIVPNLRTAKVAPKHLHVERFAL
jgi:predicted ferric reductase